MAPTGGGDVVRPTAVDVPPDDSDHGGGDGVVHGGGGERQVVVETLGDHDLGGQPGGLEVVVKGRDEDIELSRVPNGRFVRGVPVGFVLGGDGVEADAEVALDVLDIAREVGGITGVRGVGRTGGGSGKGGAGSA